jgi:hypothetical protein
MKVKDLKRKHREVVVSVWPPAWASAYGPGRTFAVSDEGALMEVRRIGNKLSLGMRLDGRDHHTLLEWDGPPTPTDLEGVLRGQIGQPHPGD